MWLCMGEVVVQRCGAATFARRGYDFSVVRGEGVVMKRGSSSEESSKGKLWLHQGEEGVGWGGVTKKSNSSNSSKAQQGV